MATRISFYFLDPRPSFPCVRPTATFLALPADTSPSLCGLSVVAVGQGWPFVCVVEDLS